MQKAKAIRFVRTLARGNSWLVPAFQAILFLGSLAIAWWLRFDFSLPNREMLWLAAPLLVLLRLAAVARFGLLHGWWRYTGLSDAFDVIKAVLCGSLGFVVIMRYGIGLATFPRSVYVIEPLITAGGLLGVRMFSRLVAESEQREQGSSKNVILIGAGIAAQMVVRQIRQRGSGYRALAYLDDDVSKAGLRFHGVPVIGPIEELPHLVQAYPVEEVLLAVPSASGAQMHRFVEICQQSGIPFKTLPALRDLISGDWAINIKELREVKVEDLLGRDPVEIDLQTVENRLRGRTVMVTGAAGSIGSELCRQILQYGPHKLLCVDQNETGMFYLERELTSRRNGTALVPCVADVGDGERMKKLFHENGPQVVFHAAAYKHVPVMEVNVQGAVKNNIFGLLTLLEVARASGCESFVLISSDKAVNPTSVMGATKRIGELIISRQPACGMRSVAVRFGNVLGSSGSVLPVLQEQLQHHEPLTVTHPDVKRFFMTTGEAVSLVLQAFVIGEHGDTLVLDMGTPVRIVDLARSLIRLSGAPEQPGAIRFIGLREGEKLTEELFYPDEEVCPTSFAKIKKARGWVQGGWNDLRRQLDELRHTLYLDGANPIRAKIRQIVPEYLAQPDGTSNAGAALEISANGVDPSQPPGLELAAVPARKAGLRWGGGPSPA